MGTHKWLRDTPPKQQLALKTPHTSLANLESKFKFVAFMNKKSIYMKGKA